MRRVVAVAILLLLAACGPAAESTHRVVTEEYPETREFEALPFYTAAIERWYVEAAHQQWFAVLDAQQLWFTVARRHSSRGVHAGDASRAAPRSRISPSEAGSGSCGGDLPPCSVMMCESGGNIRAVHHSAIRPAGKWQIITSTWDNYGGYSTADQAPESVQDERARQIYAGGAGRSQWAC